MALAGAALAMVVSRSDVEGVLREVECPSILFLVGLFVMVGAFEAVGIIGVVAGALASSSSSPGTTAVIILWGSAAASAMVDNIPFTATISRSSSSSARLAVTMPPPWNPCGGRSL